MGHQSEWSDIKTLYDMLRFRAVQDSEKTAFIYIDDISQKKIAVTYRELDSRARSIACDLKNQYKLTKGDRAILLYPPGIEFIAGFFGCLYAGVIAVPTYPPFNQKAAEKLLSIIENCTPRIILTDTSLNQSFAKLNLVNKITLIPGVNYLFNKIFTKTANLAKWTGKGIAIFDTVQSTNINEHQWDAPLLNCDSIAFLQYTSGSTGNAKGVIVTHDNLIKNLINIKNECTLTSEDILVSWLPTYHDMGLIDCVLQPIFSGFKCIFISPFAFLQNPYIWLELVTKYKATITGGPNFAFAYATSRISKENKQKLDLSSIRFIFNGAEPVHAETLKNFYETFKTYGLKFESLFPCYGLAEGTLLVSCVSDMKGYKTLSISSKDLQKNKVTIIKHVNDADTYNIVSCGFFTEDVKIVNPESSTICAPNEIGEIWISGPSVTRGYWQNEQETKLVYDWIIIDGNKDTKYLRTGDLGFIYKKELYVTGRLKDLIIINGSNYYPQDIENTVSSACSLIRTGGCVAFSEVVENDERLTLICEVKNELSQEQYAKIRQDIVRAVSLEHNISLYHLVFVPIKSIYKTTSGKVQRRATKQAMLENSLTKLYEYEHRGGQEDPPYKNKIEKANPLAARLSNLSEKIKGSHEESELNQKIIEKWIIDWIAKRENIALDLKSAKKSLNDFGLDSIAIIQLSEDVKENLDKNSYLVKDGVSLPTIFMSAQISIKALSITILNSIKRVRKTTSGESLLKTNIPIDSNNDDLPTLATANIEDKSAFATANQKHFIIATIWRESLFLSDLKLTDDFYSLGGDDVIAAIIMQRLNDIGISKRGADVIIENKTYEKIIAAIDSENLSMPIMQVLKHSKKHEANAFFFPPILGNIDYAYNLARKIKGSSYGFILPENYLDSQLSGVINEYLESIKKISKNKSAILIGWSLGALFAWKVAIALRVLGWDIKLILIDAIPFEMHEKSDDEEFETIDLTLMKQLFTISRKTRLEQMKYFNKMGISSYQKSITAFMQRMQFEYVYLGMLNEDEWLPLLSNLVKGLIYLREAVAIEPYDGEVNFILPEEVHIKNLEYNLSKCLGAVNKYFVPGDHLIMILTQELHKIIPKIASE